MGLDLKGGRQRGGSVGVSSRPIRGRRREREQAKLVETWKALPARHRVVLERRGEQPVVTTTISEPWLDPRGVALIRVDADTRPVPLDLLSLVVKGDTP